MMYLFGRVLFAERANLSSPVVSLHPGLTGSPAVITPTKTTGIKITMKFLTNFLQNLSALAMLTLVMGCAGTPSAPSPESLLSAAGFKTVVASTDKQLQEIPKLPAGQVTVITNTGKNYFVYPDLAKKQIYVGTEKEYQAYLKLRAQNNMPDANPDASYMKQDAAMRKADARDNSVYWELFPDFSGLGW